LGGVLVVAPSTHFVWLHMHVNKDCNRVICKVAETRDKELPDKDNLQRLTYIFQIRQNQTACCMIVAKEQRKPLSCVQPYIIWVFAI